MLSISKSSELLRTATKNLQKHLTVNNNTYKISMWVEIYIIYNKYI